jgi:ABC transporter transmembrane region
MIIPNQKNQQDFLRDLRKNRQNYKKIEITSEHTRYLFDFVKKEKKAFFLAILFLFLQGVSEIILILISHKLVYLGANRYMLALIVFFSGLFLFISYQSIKREKIVIIKLINNLRLHWFKLSLNKSFVNYNLEKKGGLLAKISYHLPMLSSGISNCLIGVVHWVLLLFVLLAICLVFGWSFGYWLIIIFILSLLTIFGAYFVSKNYVIKETTFYSQIIRLIDFSLSDWNFTKVFRREKNILNEFNKLVNLDSYFRVRREIWLRFGSSIIFVFLVLCSWLLNIFSKDILNIISIGLNNQFVLVIMFIYFSRIMYESFRIGIYSIPFMFGLSLSIPKYNPLPLSRNIKNKFEIIIFRTTKARFFRGGKYYKDLTFSFKRAGRYLITGSRLSGKTKLAKLFSGFADFGKKAWIIKLGKKRFSYNYFFLKYGGFFYLDPNFSSNRSILEVLVGKEKNLLKPDDLYKVSELINAHENFSDIFFDKYDWRASANKVMSNNKNRLLVQIINCLVLKPQFIVIDNFWLDLNDLEINYFLGVLAKELPNSTIIFFASKSSDILFFDDKYEI